MLVIGAGPVGLAVSRALEQAHLPYQLVDAAEAVGGNWLHGTHEHARIVSSRSTTAYSDFPMPERNGDFPDRSAMIRYLDEFARVHGIDARMQRHTSVLSLRSTQSANANRVYIAHTTRGTIEARGVYVCTGHHWAKRYPAWAQDYKLQSFHAKDYKHRGQLAGALRVLVVGSGNSAADIACDAARAGAQVDISVRSGRWLFPKTINGRPTVEKMNSLLPEALQKRVLRAHMVKTHGEFAYLGGTPNHDLFDKHPTLSDELAPMLRSGQIKQRPGVATAAADSLEFEDGRSATYDLVVYATGYDLHFPFLPEGTVAQQGSHALLYGGALTREHKHLYIVGTSQPRYGFGPLITPASALLAQYSIWQDKLHRPLGELYASIGVRPAPSPFSNPRRALRDIRLAQQLYPLLKAADSYLLRTRGPCVSPPLGSNLESP